MSIFYDIAEVISSLFNLQSKSLHNMYNVDKRQTRQKPVTSEKECFWLIHANCSNAIRGNACVLFYTILAYKKPSNEAEIYLTRFTPMFHFYNP